MVPLSRTGAWKKQLKDKAQLGYPSLHVLIFFQCGFSYRKFRLHNQWRRAPREQDRSYQRPGSGVELFPLCSGVQRSHTFQRVKYSLTLKEMGENCLTWEGWQTTLTATQCSIYFGQYNFSQIALLYI